MTSTIWAKIIYGDDNWSPIYATNEFSDKTILINLYRYIEDIKSLSGYCEGLHELIDTLIKNKKNEDYFFRSLIAFFEIFIIKFDMLLSKINNAGIPQILKDNNYDGMHLLVSKLRNLLAHRTSVDTIGYNNANSVVNMFIRQNNFDSHINNWIKAKNNEEYNGDDSQNRERTKHQDQFENKVSEYLQKRDVAIDTSSLISKINDFGINIKDVYYFISLLVKIDSMIAEKFY